MTKSSDLIDAARVARSHAHAPYSGFRVGAAVRDSEGRIHTGCNVENAAYPLGMCAEAGALSAMVAAGGTKCVEIAIVAAGPDAVAPCGGCRQRLLELSDLALPVQCCDIDGQTRLSCTLGELLPHAFSSQTLKSV